VPVGIILAWQLIAIPLINNSLYIIPTPFIVYILHSFTISLADIFSPLYSAFMGITTSHSRSIIKM
jgi:hypothetical protein